MLVFLLSDASRTRRLCKNIGEPALGEQRYLSIRLARSDLSTSRRYRLGSFVKPLRPLGVCGLQELAVVCGSYFLCLVLVGCPTLEAPLASVVRIHFTYPVETIAAPSEEP